jgi:transcription antitermination protein NusB
MSGKAARRRAREFALQAIYQWLLSGNSVTVIEAHLEQVADFDKADRELFVGLVRGIIHNAEGLRAELAPFIHRDIGALSPVEHAILLLGSFELKHSPETPYRVIINEAIELAKGYGGTDGHRFVNGVLDKLAAHLRSGEVDANRDARAAR